MATVTRADICKMADAADAFADAMDLGGKNYSTLRDEYFAQLVAVAVGAACVQECEKIRYSGYCPPEDGAAPEYYNDAAMDCEDAIKDLIENKFQFIKIGDV